MFRSKEQQFDFYWKEIFTGLAYNPIEFNTYRFDQTMSLPHKFNKLYEMFKELAMNNQEVMDYLKVFVETFDFKLETTVSDILAKWLEDGVLAELIRFAINEEVVEARDGKDSLKLRLEADYQSLDEKNNQLASRLNEFNDLFQQFQNSMNEANNNQNNQIQTNTNKINENFTLIQKLLPTQKEVNEARVGKASLREKILDQDSKIQDTKRYVDTKLQGLTDASPKETFATLSALQSTYPSGKAGVFLVAENNSTYHYYQGAWKKIGDYGKSTYTGNLEMLSKVTFTESGYFDGLAILNVVDSSLIIPKGYVHFNETIYGYEKQTLLIGGTENSPMGIVIFNVVTRKFRMEWASSLANITANDLRVAYINFKTSQCEALFPIFNANDIYINSKSASQSILTLQSDVVDVSIIPNLNDNAVTLTFPSNLDLYINRTYYNYPTHSATINVPKSKFTVYVHFNIVSHRYELYLYESLKSIPTPSILIDVINIQNIKDNVLKYSGGQANTNILDNIDYHLPSYLSNGYANFLNDFKANRMLDNKLVIALTTDTHVVGSSTRYGNISNIVALSHYFKTDYLLHLGDIVDKAESPESMKQKLSSVVTQMGKGHGKTFLIHGNHDNNFSGQGGLVSEAQIKNLVSRDNLKNISSYHDSGAYEVKDEPNKLIFFFLNSFDYPSTVQGTNDSLRYGFGASQIQWLQTRLASVPENYKVLFFSHNGFSGSSTIGDSDTSIRNQGAIRKLIESFNQSTSVAITQTNVSTNPEFYNFSLQTNFTGKTKNKIIACFSGHWHHDKNITLNGVKHYSLISSYIDTQWNNVGKTPNTVTSDSIKLLLIDKTTFETRLIGYGGNLFKNVVI